MSWLIGLWCVAHLCGHSWTVAINAHQSMADVPRNYTNIIITVPSLFENWRKSLLLWRHNLSCQSTLWAQVGLPISLELCGCSWEDITEWCICIRTILQANRMKVLVWLVMQNEWQGSQANINCSSLRCLCCCMFSQGNTEFTLSERFQHSE